MRPIIVLAVLLWNVCSPGVSLHAASAGSIVANETLATHLCVQTLIKVNEREGGVTFELTRSGNTGYWTTAYVDLYGDGRFHRPLLDTSFAPGQTTKSLRFEWDDNAVYNDTQHVRFVCGGRGALASPTTSEGTFIFTDDEPYPVLIAPESIEVTETDAQQPISIPISYIPSFGDWPDLRVELEHVTTNSHDLKLLSTYPSGTIDLEITGDDLPESDETLLVRIVGDLQKFIPLTIRDDDRPPFPYSFDQDHYEFDEAHGDGSVIVRRTGSLSSAVELLLNFRPTIPGAGVETIPVLLSPGQASTEVPIPIDDAYFTDTRHGTLELELDGFVGATASLTVKDDEAMPSLSVGDGSVREGNLDQHPRLEIPVTLSAPLGAMLQLGLSPSHVTTDADDLSLLPATVTIPAGALTGTAAFQVNGDLVLESDETFSVTLRSCCDGLAAVARSVGTATIVNDDAEPTETIYRLALGTTTIREYERWLSIPVRRFGRVSVSTHATLKLTSSDERVFAPRTVSFAPNETAVDTHFYINDFLHLGNAAVKVELLDGNRLLESASVSIMEDDDTPRLWILGESAREGVGKTVSFTVHLDPPSLKPISLHLRSHSGTAKQDDDFQAFDKIMELPPGTAESVVAVPVRDDPVPEVTEKFDLQIVAVDGDDVRFQSFSSSASIEDDDTAYVENEPNVVRDTLTTISVHFPSPAPSKDAIRVLAEPTSLEAPATVPIPAGARSVSFQVKAKRLGETGFAIEMPLFLSSVRVTKKINVYDEHTVTLTPAALELAPGASARVVITIGPDSAPFTLQRPDWKVAATETTAALDGKPSFFVHGLTPGQTEILVTLPASVGGATVRLPVVVKEPDPPVSPRKRAARH